MLRVYDKDKTMFYVYKDTEILNINTKDHYAGRHLPVIVKDLNKFFEFVDDEFNKQYLDVLLSTLKSGIIDNFVEFLFRSDVDKVLKEFVNEYGFKNTERAKTELYFEQNEIDQLLILTLRNKLALPLSVKFPDKTSYLQKSISKDITIGRKLFRIILNRLTPFKYNDNAAWKFMKAAMFGNMDIYTVMLLEFIQTKIILTCSIDKNPLVFILSVASDCMRWMSHIEYMYSDELPKETIFTIKSTKYISVMSTIKQFIIKEFDSKLIDIIESESRILAPLHRIWAFVMKKHLQITKISSSDAAILSLFVSRLLQRSELLSTNCNYMLKVSPWIPVAKVGTERLDDTKILSRSFVLYNVDVKPFVRNELQTFKTKYTYFDPLTKKKNIISIRSLENDLLNFFDIVCQNKLDKEVKECVLPYLNVE